MKVTHHKSTAAVPLKQDRMQMDRISAKEMSNSHAIKVTNLQTTRVQQQ
jgi:hypothetical protein